MRYTTISVPSTVPATSRPIYITPVADCTFKNKEVSYPRLAESITKLLSSRPGRVLVHTVSYDLATYLATHISTDKDIHYYTSVSNRDDAINDYLLGSTEAVLFAPSLARGVDFPQDQCRTVIIAKVPFPNLADKQVNARVYGTGRAGKTWYAVETIRSIVQMTGRGMRSEDDYCETYILDRQFTDNILKRHKHLLPSWYKEALVFGKDI
jgi:ATP-dependent DNA helicase DinG